jgi:UDP-glucose 4-epimerase
MPNKINATKNRKVIITGGAGFIGANLAKELAAKNSVIIIDNLPAGKKENIKNRLGER